MILAYKQKHLFQLFEVFVFCILLITASGTSVFAQEGKGIIFGTVTDAKTGEGLPTVNVKIKGSYFGASTDIDGKYEIRGISPGSYILEFSMVGFTTVQVTDARVLANDRTQYNQKMSETVLSIGQEVLVVGEKPLFNIEETSSKRTMTREDIQLAPVSNVRDIIATQVGVVQTDEAIHIRGGREYEHAMIVDGVSVQDPLAGTGFGLQLSTNAIQEVEIITGGINAEYGQATSGVINVTTRDGGDSYRGSASYKRDHLGNVTKGQFKTDIAEISLSGPEPITSTLFNLFGLPGKVFFFGNAFGNISNGAPFAVTGLNANQLHSSIWYDTKYAPRMENNWFGMFKLTWNITPIMKLSYSFSKSIAINQNSQSLQSNLEYVAPSPGYQYLFQYIQDNANTYTHLNTKHTISWLHTLNNKTFYEIRLSSFFTQMRADANGQYWYKYNEPKDIITLPPTYFNLLSDTLRVIPGDGFYNTGNADTWHDHFVQETTLKVELTSNFNEKNKFKTGIEASFQHMQLVDIYKPWIGELGYNNDRYTVYPAFGALYAQDNISFGGLILNFGLRLDYWFPGDLVDKAVENKDIQFIPDEIRERYKKETFSLFGHRGKARLSPRLGISHPVSDNQTLFFSYGHFSKRPKPQFVYAKLEPSQANSSYQKYGNPNLNPETTVAYEIGLRNQFTNDDVLTVTAYYKDIFDYVTTQQAKVARLGQAAMNFVTYVNLDYARSRGIEIEYKKRIGRWFRSSFSMSYSIVTGKSSSPDEGLLAVRGDQAESIKETYLNWDRPLQSSLSLNFYKEKNTGIFGFGRNVLDNWNLNMRFFYQSGKRYTPYIPQYDNVTGLQSTLSNGKPIYALDNTNRYGAIGNDWFYLDLNFEKYFSVGGIELVLSLEILNVFDNFWPFTNKRVNATILNPVTGMAYEYGQNVPTNWNDPRFPELQAPIDPYPYNPSRYLPPRQVRGGISLKF